MVRKEAISGPGFSRHQAPHSTLCITPFPGKLPVKVDRLNWQHGRDSIGHR
jgi:hypothetical protein